MSVAEGQFASPPCFLHELDPHYVDPQQRIDVFRWRKAERERLIGARVAMDAGDRQERMGRIARHLEAAFGAIAGQTISFYGPFRGEPDPRDLMARVVTAGGIIGSVVEVKPDVVVLRVDEGRETKLTFTRDAITTILNSAASEVTEVSATKTNL